MREVDIIGTDVLVIGAGAAGLSAALAARATDVRVVVVSVTAPHTGSATAITQVAGAFLAAALGVADARDGPEVHAEDTIEAGRRLGDAPLVWHRVSRISALLSSLERYGIAFTTDARGRLLQFHSPGHRYPRTIAYGPAKGLSLVRSLIESATGAGVGFLSGVSVTQLIVDGGEVRGAIGWDLARRRPVVIGARAVVLASGGAGLCYPRTGLPRATGGAGYGLALRAGCTLLDMEFVQWYPAALAEAGEATHLIHYDSLLDRGAVFRTEDGADLLAGYTRDPQRGIPRDEMAELIARATIAGRLRSGRMFIDLSACRSLDDHPVLRSSPYVPLLQERVGRPGGGLWVSPAAHYCLGGVLVTPGGETGTPGLFAAGEVAGGIFGANRLEGNALTDCVVGGDEAGRRAAARASARLDAGGDALAEHLWRDEAGRLRAVHARRPGVRIAEAVEELQGAMDAGAGLVRSADGLRRALDRIRRLQGESDRIAAPEGQDLHLAVFGHVLTTAEAIVLGSLARQESRGAFIRKDCPEETPIGGEHHTTLHLVGERLEPGRRSVARTAPVAS